MARLESVTRFSNKSHDVLPVLLKAISVQPSRGSDRLLAAFTFALVPCGRYDDDVVRRYRLVNATIPLPCNMSTRGAMKSTIERGM